MSTQVKGVRNITIAHICSKCKKPVVQNLMLSAIGAANAFRHEKQMAAEAQEQAYDQAYMDIAECRKNPRRLGSVTGVSFDTNRKDAHYQILLLDTPCPECGHIEAWQMRKKSLWNPRDDDFLDREVIPNVPMESRPALLDSQAAVDAWKANPAAEVISQMDIVEEEEIPVPPPVYTWECKHCGFSENGLHDYSCKKCGKGKA